MKSTSWRARGNSSVPARVSCSWAGLPRVENPDTESKTEPVGESTAVAGGPLHAQACLPPPPPSSSSSILRLEVTLALDSPNFKGRAESSLLQKMALGCRWGHANPRLAECGGVHMHASEIRLRGECHASHTRLRPIRLASVTTYEKRRASYPVNILILQRASGNKSRRKRGRLENRGHRIGVPAFFCLEA